MRPRGASNIRLFDIFTYIFCYPFPRNCWQHFCVHAFMLSPSTALFLRSRALVHVPNSFAFCCLFQSRSQAEGNSHKDTLLRPPFCVCLIARICLKGILTIAREPLTTLELLRCAAAAAAPSQFSGGIIRTQTNREKQERHTVSPLIPLGGHFYKFGKS